MSASVPGLGDRRRWRRLRVARSVVVAALVGATLFGVSAGPAAPVASADGSYLMWDEGGSDFRIFGPNAPVTIWAGQIGFLCDQFFPVADIYVVADAPSLADVLVDVSPSPNTVFGATGGLFMDEIIGFTVPAGQLSAGWYTVVYDECQDGVFGPEDSAFVDAFYVEIPADIPPIDPAIGALKARAAAQTAIYDGYANQLETLDRVDKAMKIAQAAQACLTGAVAGAAACGTVVFGSVAADLLKDAICEAVVGTFAIGCAKEMAMNVIADAKKHYAAIAADPPDPAFEQATGIGPIEPIPDSSQIALDAAGARLADVVATEAALAEGLLHAIERYQGADAAGDGRWALAQARQARELAVHLREQLDRVQAAALALESAFTAGATLIDGGIALYDPIQDAVEVGGFQPADERALRNLGFDLSEIADLEATIAAANVDGMSAAGMAADVRSLTDATTVAQADLDAFLSAIDGPIASLEGDAGTPDDLPIADAGGPYAVAEGVATALDGSGSGGTFAITAFDWDLDRDGAFDDATGPAPSWAFPASFDGLVGLRVTDRHGRHGIAYARVTVGEANAAPNVVAASPESPIAEIVVGSSATFSLDTDDPDDDAVDVAWLLDAGPGSAGSGSSLVISPTAADVGVHALTGAVSDGRPDGGTRLVNWLVFVRAVDADDDLWTATTDCDDANAAVNPGASEIAVNGIDDDCDPGTSDDGLGPTAAFVSSAPAGGRNVALLDVGPAGSTPSPVSAVAVAESPAYASNWAMSAALDTETMGASWAAGPAALRYGVVRLWANQAWLVDRVAIMPRADYQPQRVRDFAVDVSTTGFASESDWTTVLTATAADSGDLQSFDLPGGPVPAKYVRVRLLTNRGDPTYISVSQFKVYSPQQSAGSTFDFEDRSIDPEDDIVAREWDFGDGATSTATDPSHTYAGPGTYTVTLTATDSRGHTDATSLVHRVLAPPTGTFTPTPNPSPERENVFVTPTVADPDGERIVRIEWSWGDGTPETISTWLGYNGHLYVQDGVYTIRLTVTDAQEQVTQVDRTVTITNRPPNASLSNRTVIGGLPFTFNANPFDLADPITCEWDWGDGSPLTTGCDPKVHVYPSPAPGASDTTYTQTFRVTDDHDTTTRTATITVTSSLPDRILPDGRSFLFEAPALLTQVTGTTTCVWDFGDGSTPVAGCGNKNHAYPAMSPGAPDAVYALSLQVTRGADVAVLAGEMRITASAGPVHYQTDFTGGASAEWSGITTTEGVQGFADFGFEGVFLHNRTTTSPTTLTFVGLPPHDAVSLGFLLAVVDSWDGNFCSAGPDRLNIRVDGALVFSEVLENSGCGAQSYVPAPGVELARHRQIGFGSGGFFADSVYNMSLEPRFRNIPHSGTSLTVEFSQATVGAADESFALDDFEVMLHGVSGSDPVADAGGPYATNEGTLVLLDGSASSDDDGDPLTYAWDLDDDGDFDDATAATIGLTPDDGPATLIVHLRVTDAGGRSSTDAATIEVANVAPTAVLSAPSSVLEDGSYAVSLGAAFDPSPADAASLEFAFDCGLGAGYGAFGTSSTTSCTAGDDDVDGAVRATVRDRDGGATEYTASVGVLNAPPTGTFLATASVDEGSAASLVWTSATDPSAADAALLRYTFTCDETLGLPGSVWADASAGPGTTCTYLDDGSIGVQGRVLDPDNASSTTGAVVTVRNVAPTASLSAPVSVGEGGSFTLGLVGPTDPSPVDTAAGFRYAFDCGDGAGYGDWSTIPSVTCPALPNDGQQAVAARITDKDGGVTPYAAVVAVVNIPPSVSLASDGPTAWGLQVELTATAVDPSPVDATGLTYAWDLDGDGVFELGPSTDPNVAYAYPAPQQVDAAVRACDDDACATATTQVVVTRRGTSLTDQTAASVQYGDPLIVRSVLEDVVVAGAVVGRPVTLSAGSDSSPATTDTAGVAAATFVVGLPAGASLAAQSAFAGDSRYGPSSASRSVAVTAEDATVEYSGDTFATGTVARLAATVTEAADGSLGDITKASVTFDVYSGATACGSGAPTRYGPIAVVDTGTVGDGIGIAEYAMATPSEQTYCIVARLTGAGQTTPNPYYAGVPAQGAVLTVVSTTGKFATGGGWIADSLTGGRGNFGFTARFTKSGAPKGQAVYVWRTVRDGELVDVIVKSSSVTSLSFADDRGTGTWPWRATMTGKATIRVNLAATGSELWTDGNASFTLVAVDSGTSSGAGVDSFALRVLDKNGSVYRVVGEWSGSTWTAGVVLSGGNVMVHLK